MPAPRSKRSRVRRCSNAGSSLGTPLPPRPRSTNCRKRGSRRLIGLSTPLTTGAICAIFCGAPSTTTTRAISTSSRSPRSAVSRRRFSSPLPTWTRWCRGIHPSIGMRPQHHVRLHTGRNLSDAARTTVHRSDVAQPRRRSSRGRRRHDDQRGRRCTEADVYLADVRNRAQLAYPAVGAWLEGQPPAAREAAAGQWPRRQSALQDAAARALKESRHRRGALTLDTIEGRPVFAGDNVRDIDHAAPLARLRADRGLHDCRQQLHRPISRAARILFPPPHRSHAGTVAAHRRARRGNGDSAAGDTG